MKTLLFFSSALFFIAAIISWAQRYLDADYRAFRKYQILQRIKNGERVPYNNTTAEMIAAGVITRDQVD